MSELRDLYQDVILDHNRRPRNFREPENANRTVEGYNPLCGDHFTVYLQIDSDIIRDIGFQGSGCAISKASASLMTESVKGKTVAEAERLFAAVHTMLTEQHTADAELNTLGKLSVLSGVWEFPTRVKCASLAWYTLHAALGGEQTAVSTE